MTKDAKDMSLEEIGKRITQMDSTPLPGSTPFSEAAREFLLARVWNSDLSWREKRLISLTCIAIAGQPVPFEAHIHGALKSGDFTVHELHVFALHVSAYAGFPVGAGAEMMIQKVAAGMEKS